jgi:hypothetical protein
MEIRIKTEGNLTATSYRTPVVAGLNQHFAISILVGA